MSEVLTTSQLCMCVSERDCPPEKKHCFPVAAKQRREQCDVRGGGVDEWVNKTLCPADIGGIWKLRNVIDQGGR